MNALVHPIQPESAIWPATVQPIYLVDWADKDPPDRRWHVEGLVSIGAVTSLYGHGGSGKSMLALELMVETAAASHFPGRKWLGRDVAFGVTLGLFAEDDAEECVRRVKRICRAKGLNVADHAASLQIVSLLGEDATLVEFPPDDREAFTTPLFRRLEELVAEHFPSVLVLDYAAAMFGGSEMSRAQVGAFMRVLNGFAVKHKLAILLLGHPSMEGLKNGRGFSGSTAWHNNARCFLHLETVEGEEAEDGRSRSTVSVRKNNYGRSGDVFKLAFDGATFELIEEARATGPVKRQPRISPAQKIALQALKRALDEGGEPSPGGPLPTGIRVVKIDLWREYSYSAGVSGSDDKDSRRRAFFDSRKSLQAKGLVGLHEPFAWLP